MWVCVCVFETTPLVLVGHLISLFIVETGDGTVCKHLFASEVYAPILSSLYEAHFSDTMCL